MILDYGRLCLAAATAGLAAQAKFTHVDISRREQPQRDVNGPLPVFKLQKADCEEIGKGNKDISLCAKDTEPAVAAPLLDDCLKLGNKWLEAPKTINYTIWGVSGYANEGTCWMEVFNANDPLSTRGLLNITFDAGLIGNFIKKQATACFTDKYKTDFSYAHCTIRDPMVFFKLWQKPASSQTG